MPGPGVRTFRTRPGPAVWQMHGTPGGRAVSLAMATAKDGAAAKASGELKDALVLIRMDARSKSRLEAAALARGQSLSDFACEVLNQVAVEGHPSHDPTVHFALLCSAAHAGKPTGFNIVGQWLARNLAALQPPTIRTTIWWAKITDLQSLAVRGTPTEVLEWLLEHLPRIAVTIPHKRMPQLVQGLIKGFADEEAAPARPR